MQLFVTPWTAACQASLSITTSRSLLKLMSIESGIPSKHLILCCPLLLPPWIFPSIRVFSSESVLHIRCPKYWSFSFSISPSNEYSGLISFRMDWLDLLAVQGTLKSLLQHHSLKASILWHSAFFIVHLSHPYMTTGKTVALIWQAFVGKVMSLLFNMRSTLVITFLQVDFKGIILPDIMGKRVVGGVRGVQFLHPISCKSLSTGTETSWGWNNLASRLQPEKPCMRLDIAGLFCRLGSLECNLDF